MQNEKSIQSKFLSPQLRTTRQPSLASTQGIPSPYLPKISGNCEKVTKSNFFKYPMSQVDSPHTIQRTQLVNTYLGGKVQSEKMIRTDLNQKYEKKTNVIRSHRNIRLPNMDSVRQQTSIVQNTQIRHTSQPRLSPQKLQDTSVVTESDAGKSDVSCVWDNQDLEERGLRDRLEKLNNVEQFILLYKYRYEQHPNSKNYLPNEKLKKVVEKFGTMGRTRRRNILQPEFAENSLILQDYSEPIQKVQSLKTIQQV